MKYLKTAASMGGTSAQWANHHFRVLPIFAKFTIMIPHHSILKLKSSPLRRIIPFRNHQSSLKLQTGRKTVIRADGMRQSRMVHSASSIGCLKPLTFTGISCRDLPALPPVVARMMQRRVAAFPLHFRCPFGVAPVGISAISTSTFSSVPTR